MNNHRTPYENDLVLLAQQAFAQEILSAMGWPTQMEEDPAILLQRVQAKCLKVLDPATQVTAKPTTI